MLQREQEATSGTDRLCDYQAMFLVELLSQYGARRAAKVLSSRFKKTYYKVSSFVTLPPQKKYKSLSIQGSRRFQVYYDAST